MHRAANGIGDVYSVCIYQIVFGYAALRHVVFLDGELAGYAVLTPSDNGGVTS